MPVLCTTGAWSRRAENCGVAAVAVREPVHLGEACGDCTGAVLRRGTLDAYSGVEVPQIQFLAVVCLATETGTYSANCAVGSVMPQFLEVCMARWRG